MSGDWAGIRCARVGAVGALMLAFACVPLFARQNSGTSAAPKPAVKKTTAKASSVSGKRSSRKKKSGRLRGQQKIDSERARAIQEALIREHYLSGAPTGTWNQSSEEAMRRYQGDHGWQTKQVPDSRALIKLGLGPSKDHLLNPESAMVTGPDSPRAQPLAPTSQGPQPVSSAPNAGQNESASPQ